MLRRTRPADTGRSPHCTRSRKDECPLSGDHSERLSDASGSGAEASPGAARDRRHQARGARVKTAWLNARIQASARPQDARLAIAAAAELEALRSFIRTPISTGSPT